MKGIDEALVKFIIDYYKESQFYPSYEEVARGLNCSKATVHDRMKLLEGEGVIRRKGNRSSQYWLINMGVILKNELAEPK